MKIKSITLLFALNAASFVFAADKEKKDEVNSDAAAKKKLTVLVPESPTLYSSSPRHSVFLRALSSLPIGTSPTGSDSSPTSSINSTLSTPSSSANSSAYSSPVSSVKKSSPSSSTEDESSAGAQQ